MPSTYTNLNVHIVFATKNRAPLIGDEWRADLHAYLGGCAKQIEVRPICTGGTADHVHMLVAFKSSQTIADVVRDIKTASSVWASHRCKGFSWQPGYGGFTFGRSELARLVRYVENQEEHHKKISPVDELRALLAEEGVEYDPRFFE